jgi:hypothetical protein
MKKTLKSLNVNIILITGCCILSLLTLILMLFPKLPEIDFYLGKTRDSLLNMATIVGTITAISIPLSIQTILTGKSELFEKEINLSFTNNWYYKIQFWNIGFIFIYVFVAIIFKENEIISIVGLFLFIFILITFSGFSKVVKEYSLNYRKIINEEARDAIESIIK